MPQPACPLHIMRCFLRAGLSRRHLFLSSAHTVGASCQRLSSKHQTCRVGSFHSAFFYTLFPPHATCWRGLSYLNFCWEAAHARTSKNVIVFFSLSSLSSSNTEIICKEIIGLARAGLLHTNFVRLTSRGQCSMWPLARRTRIYFIRLKRRCLE